MRHVAGLVFFVLLMGWFVLGCAAFLEHDSNDDDDTVEPADDDDTGTADDDDTDTGDDDAGPGDDDDDTVEPGDDDDDTDGDDDTEDCPDETPLQSIDPCPEACTGGCSGTQCFIACNHTSSCNYVPLVCPDYMACTVECHGTLSCAFAAIQCSPHGPCDIQCDGTSSCQQASMDCAGPDGCDLSCGGDASCQIGSFSCSEGPCGAECTGATAGNGMTHGAGPSCDYVDDCP